MAVVQRKTKDGGVVYRVRVRDPFGRWYPSKTYERKADAVRYERELLSQKDRGGQAKLAELRQLTFRQYWDLWSQECRSNVSEGWRRTQNRVWRLQIEPLLGDRRLLEIRSMDVGRVLAHEQERGYGSQSLMHVYNILHKMFEDAVEHYEFLDHNPVRRRYRPKIAWRERPFLTPEESWRLLEAARETWAGPAIWVAILSGLRPSEIQALRWRSVDFDRMQILICAAFNRKLRVMQAQPKQADWGIAPIPPVLAEYLKELRVGRSDEDFVCAGQQRDWPAGPGPWAGMLNYESFTRVLTRLCKKAGVKRVTPHELRHSCTELYVQAGASAEDLRRLLNHKSLTATIRYMHRTDERLQRIASQVGPTPLPALSPILEPTAHGGGSKLRRVK